jgi:hypothetical protein
VGTEEAVDNGPSLGDQWRRSEELRDENTIFQCNGNNDVDVDVDDDDDAELQAELY